MKKALALARQHKLPKQILVGYIFDLGRFSGYLGHHQQATELLEEACRVEEELSGATSVYSYKRNFEAARFYFDREQYTPAVHHFDIAVNGADVWGLQFGDPIGLAERLDEYATALSKTKQDKRAEEVRVWSAYIREKNKGRKANKSREKRYK